MQQNDSTRQRLPPASPRFFPDPDSFDLTSSSATGCRCRIVAAPIRCFSFRFSPSFAGDKETTRGGGGLDRIYGNIWGTSQYKCRNLSGTCHLGARLIHHPHFLYMCLSLGAARAHLGRHQPLGAEPLGPRPLLLGLQWRRSRRRGENAMRGSEKTHGKAVRAQGKAVRMQ